jgi:hypothetical protein
MGKCVRMLGHVLTLPLEFYSPLMMVNNYVHPVQHTEDRSKLFPDVQNRRVIGTIGKR